MNKTGLFTSTTAQASPTFDMEDAVYSLSLVEDEDGNSLVLVAINLLTVVMHF